MVTGVACGLQNRYGAFVRPGWVRFPHVPAIGRRSAAPVRIATFLAVSALVAGATSMAAQDPRSAPPDTARTAGATSRADTIPPVSPLGALARSMVVPGWGQVEVGRPGRGAIYFAAEAASLFMVFKSQSTLSAAKRARPRDGDLIDSRTQERENWIVLSVFIAFISGLDAWVSANFWDFEPRIEAPTDGSAGLALSLSLGFP